MAETQFVRTATPDEAVTVRYESWLDQHEQPEAHCVHCRDVNGLTWRDDHFECATSCAVERPARHDWRLPLGLDR